MSANQDLRVQRALAIAEQLLRATAPDDAPKPGTPLFDEAVSQVAEFFLAIAERAELGEAPRHMVFEVGPGSGEATRRLFDGVRQRAADKLAEEFGKGGQG